MTFRLGPSGPVRLSGQRIRSPITDCSLTIHWPRNNINKKSIENKHKGTKVVYIQFTKNELFSLVSLWCIEMLDLPERGACVLVAENTQSHG